MRDIFRRTATSVSNASGRAGTFFVAVILVAVWAFSGQYFDYSDTWQLVINTGTTIITFLMVFLIQNTQSRESKAVQVKLDALLKEIRDDEDFIDIEDLSDEELAELSARFKVIRETDKDKSSALTKLHARINMVLNARLVEIPGEKHIKRYLPFSEGKKITKK